MGAKFRSWWQQIKQHRVAIGVVGIVSVVVIVIIIIGYQFDWTGFNGYNKVTITHTISGTNAGTVTRTEEYQPGKGLWDWLATGSACYSCCGRTWSSLVHPEPSNFVIDNLQISEPRARGRLQNKKAERERELTRDNQQETSLQSYFDKMSELLLNEGLRKSKPEDEVRKIARGRSLTVLPRLDAKRKGSALQFLYESDLIDKDNTIINLFGLTLVELLC